MSTDTVNVLDKITLILDELLTREFPHPAKSIYANLVNIIISGKRLSAFFLRAEARQRCLLSPP